MDVKLTLQEKLNGLRKDVELRLSDVAERTGISVATLQRIETQPEYHACYQDIAVLAKFYDVSADYLFDLTDNKKHRNIEVDKLQLSDEAIEVLVTKKMNHRLLCDLISHESFQKLLSAIEVYIDRKIETQIDTMNAMYHMAEEMVKENCVVFDDDETMKILLEMPIDKEEFLRYRISERFNIILKGIYDSYEKGVQKQFESKVAEQTKLGMQVYNSTKGSPEQKKKALLAYQLGLNINEINEEETRILLKVLTRSNEKKARKNRKAI